MLKPAEPFWRWDGSCNSSLNLVRLFRADLDFVISGCRWKKGFSRLDPLGFCHHAIMLGVREQSQVFFKPTDSSQFSNGMLSEKAVLLEFRFFHQSESNRDQLDRQCKLYRCAMSFPRLHQVLFLLTTVLVELYCFCSAVMLYLNPTTNTFDWVKEIFSYQEFEPKAYILKCYYLQTLWAKGKY